jgi:hypothetical protein
MTMVGDDDAERERVVKEGPCDSALVGRRIVGKVGSCGIIHRLLLYTTQHLTTNIHDLKPRCGRRSCPKDSLKRLQATTHKLSASSKHVLNTNSATSWFKGHRIDSPSECWSNRQGHSNAGHDG